MSVYNVSSTSGGDPMRLILQQTEKNVNKYINRVEKYKWAYQFNRIFISPGNSFNVKYIIKVSIKKKKPLFLHLRVRFSSSNNNLSDIPINQF